MRLALVAALLWAASSAFAETRVVFGSFGNADNAASLTARVWQSLGVEAEVITTGVDGARRHRVVGPARSAAAATALRDRAIAAGWLDAWLWREAPPAAPVAKAPTAVATEPIDLPSTATVVADDLPGGPAPPALADALPETDADAVPAEAPTQANEVVPGLRLTTPAGGAVAVPRRTERALGFTLDGALDEPFWAELPGYDNMVVVEPDTLTPARFRTVTRFFHTERGLYVGAWMEQPPETLLARLSSRDQYINRDSFGLTLDTSGTGLYGYWFSVNLGGTVMDGKVAPERDFSYEWDGPWESATSETGDGWSMEMFLPWAMMAMPATEGDREMGFWVNRKVAYIDERWGWPALPFTAARFMSRLGKLRLSELTPQPQLTLFPYVAGTHDRAADGDEAWDTGLDVFWRPSSNFQVTAAITPDFGSVESDDVVINLTSRETFFPEKRLFFVEGNEIFLTSPRSAVSRPGSANAGGASSSIGARSTKEAFTRPPTTVLNTRRIGGKALLPIPDDVEVAGHEEARPTDLLGAAKLTGQSGAFRYGVLTALEDDPMLRGTRNGEEVLLDGHGRDFGVLRGLLESVGDGRRSLGYIGTILDHPLRQAVVHGLDAHYLRGDGKVKLDVQLLQSDIDDAADGRETGYGFLSDVIWTPRRGVRHRFRADYTDETLNINDLGYLDRNNLGGMSYGFDYTRAGMRRFRQWRSGFMAGYWVNDEGHEVRRGIFIRNSLMFHNGSEVRTEFNYFPWRWDDLESRGHGTFRKDDRLQAQIAYGTETSKPFSWSVVAGAFREDLDGWNYRAGLGFTLKPGHRFSLDMDFVYNHREAWLLHQEGRDFTTFRAKDWQPSLAMDFFISARQQLRLTMQWAGIRAEEREFFRVPEQPGPLLRVAKAPGAPSDDFTISRLTAQLRYRWQIAPLSDLFIVYTRGSNLPDLGEAPFDDLFRDALREPVIDLFVLKLRYRFGS